MTECYKCKKTGEGDYGFLSCIDGENRCEDCLIVCDTCGYAYDKDIGSKIDDKWYCINDGKAYLRRKADIAAL